MVKFDDSAFFLCWSDLCLLGFTDSSPEWQTDNKYAVTKLMKYLLTIFPLYLFFPGRWDALRVLLDDIILMPPLKLLFKQGIFSCGCICISRCETCPQRQARLRLGLLTSCVATLFCHIQVMATGKSIIQSVLNLQSMTRSKHVYYA